MVKPSKKKAKKIQKKIQDTAKSAKKKLEKTKIEKKEQKQLEQEQKETVEIFEQFSPQVEPVNIEELMREPSRADKDDALEQVAAQFIPVSEEEEEKVIGSEYVKVEEGYSSEYKIANVEDTGHYPGVGKEQAQYATDKQPVFEEISPLTKEVSEKASTQYTTRKKKTSY